MCNLNFTNFHLNSDNKQTKYVKRYLSFQIYGHQRTQIFLFCVITFHPYRKNTSHILYTLFISLQAFISLYIEIKWQENDLISPDMLPQYMEYIYLQRSCFFQSFQSYKIAFHRVFCYSHYLNVISFSLCLFSDHVWKCVALVCLFDRLCMVY